MYYYELEDSISEEVPEEQSWFVIDVLKMYQTIDVYKTTHPQDREVIDHPRSSFVGFSGTEERGSMEFTQFAEKHLSFTELSPYAEKTRHWNSPNPMNAVYGRMLDKWRELRKSADFKPTREEVLAILQASNEP